MSFVVGIQHTTFVCPSVSAVPPPRDLYECNIFVASKSSDLFLVCVSLAAAGGGRCDVDVMTGFEHSAKVEWKREEGGLDPIVRRHLSEM